MNWALPKGWVLARLGDVTEKVPSVNPALYGAREFGYVDISSIDNRRFAITEVKQVRGNDAPSRARRSIRPDDVLFSNVRTYLRNVALVPEDTIASVCSTGFTVLRPGKALLPRFLFHYVLSDAFLDRVTPKQTGTHYPATSDRRIMEEQIPLPPLREQQRIAAALDRVLAKVEECRAHLARARTLLENNRQAVLSAACTGRLTADWRHDPGDAGRGLPATWQESRLCDLFEVRTGGTPSRRHPEYYRGGTIPWIKTSELKNGEVSNAEEFITQEGMEHSNARLFPAGTILIAMYGEGRTRGQIGWLRFAATTNQACAALMSGALRDYSRKYVFFYLLGQYAALRSVSVGGNQPNLNLGLIKEWRLPLPPEDEQREIVQRVGRLMESVDVAVRRITRAEDVTAQLIPAILRRAFSGDLNLAEVSDSSAYARPST